MHDVRVVDGKTVEMPSASRVSPVLEGDWQTANGNSIRSALIATEQLIAAGEKLSAISGDMKTLRDDLISIAKSGDVGAALNASVVLANSIGLRLCVLALDLTQPPKKDV